MLKKDHPSGSSPRSWGTVGWRLFDWERFRFIPTLVGNGPAAMSASPRPAVHPHARGERFRLQPIVQFLRGSSPRSWGTGRVRRRRVRRRFIPTLVGNGGEIPPCIKKSPVHPHARGERMPMPLPRRTLCGSSPRSWGTDVSLSLDSENSRFIPTLVGNGCFSGRNRLDWTVHPHARGERMNSLGPQLIAVGSSPRSWGTAGASARIQCRWRFIPTLVGNGPDQDQ